MGSLDSFIASIPKTETHLHVEGALPYELLVELDPERFPLDPDFRKPEYRYANFVDFEKLLIDHAVVWYTSPERYHIACKRIFERLARSNVKYVETSLHLAMTEFIGADGRELASAIKSAAPDGMEIRVIGAFVRNALTEKMRPVIESCHAWDELDGVDLHGQEWLDLEDWALPVWKRFKEQGKIIKAHAGEFGGPENIEEVLNKLGVERVQHGVRAVENPDLVKRLADEGIVLDICPISNEKLRVFESLEDHSIRDLHVAGVSCTVSTDDPLCFANSIDDEYRALADRLGFTRAELAEIAKNGFRHARMEESLKTNYIDQIDRLACQ